MARQDGGHHGPHGPLRRKQYAALCLIISHYANYGKQSPVGALTGAATSPRQLLSVKVDLPVIHYARATARKNGSDSGQWAPLHREPPRIWDFGNLMLGILVCKLFQIVDTSTD